MWLPQGGALKIENLQFTQYSIIMSMLYQSLPSYNYNHHARAAKFMYCSVMICPRTSLVVYLVHHELTLYLNSKKLRERGREIRIIKKKLESESSLFIKSSQGTLDEPH